MGSYVTAAAMADKAGGKSAAARKRQYPVARVKGSWCDAEDEALRRCGEAGSSGELFSRLTFRVFNGS